MTEARKRVDESWKEQVEKEKQQPAPGAPAASPTEAGASDLGMDPGDASAQTADRGARPGSQGEPELPEARFDLFISGLAMDALIALGEVPHPATRRQSMNLQHARYMIDLLGIVEEKTRGNLSVDEERLLKDTVYQLRMRYLSKTQQPPR